MSDKIVELEITDLAFDGKSVAHLDGKVVFLKGGLPGEIVKAEIYREKPRYNEGIVREIIKKSDLRIKPLCSHFEICGGCTWQDLNYQSQLDFKKKQVIDCLGRIGSLKEIKVKDVIGSVELFDYRNKMEFSFNTDSEKGFTLGLHHRGHFDKVFDLEKCYLQSDIASEIVNWVRDYIIQEDIPIYDVIEHTGYMRFLMIRQAKRTTDLMVNIVTNYGDFPNSETLIKQITEKFPQITTIIHSQNGQKSNIAVGEIEKIIFGKGFITEKLFSSSFRIKANSFFQTNSIQTETLYRTAFEMLHPKKTDNIMDLYCGTGSIGILIAKYANEVIGVELVAESIESAKLNALDNHVSNIKFFEGNVKDFLRTYHDDDIKYNIVIVDPPRAGLHPKALKRMLELKPEKILYISCNPATFSRDAKSIVEKGYKLSEVQPVDMFPHTMHIELISVFYRD